PRNPASEPLPVPNAIVLFCLNLPPKQTVNHKVKLIITLAYGKKTPKSQQNKKPKNTQISIER
uniref:hypothetical protein n=1 Tax=Klebsiella pneumoniae TaxID=573 RepID=UPI00300A24D3